MVASVAADLVAALDPVRLAAAAGIEPDEWQRDVLRSDASRLLLNCSRQSGKSTVSAVLALHTALYQPGSLVLIVSPTLRQSAELFRKVADVFNATGDSVPTNAETQLRLELKNGSRLISLPGKEATVRGYSGVRLLLIDEASRVPDDLYRALRPMLATSRGRLVALSTPWGRRGWWADAWHGSEDWQRVEVPATACPRIPAAFLEEERRTLGEAWFRSEYLCEFIEAETQAFRRDDIDRAFSREIELWQIDES